MTDASMAGLEGLLAAWLPQNDDAVRPLMTLSTLGADGYPDARTVLLSAYDTDGFFFHTDGGSRKAAELAADSRVALTLVWPGRQLVVQGDAQPASPDELAWAYEHRSRYLRLLAWLNTPALAQRPLQERIAAWSAFAEEHPDDTLTPPATWAGYLVRPKRLTFWEGRDDTASRRTEFTAVEGGWKQKVLPG